MTHVGKFHPEFVLEYCAECGQPFHRSQQRKEFCSVECYQANVRDQVTRFCEGGGASVVVKAPHADVREYCSRCATATATGRRGPVRCVARSSRRPPRTGKAEGTLFARMNARAPVK